MAKQQRYLWTRTSIAAALGVDRHKLKAKNLPQPIRIASRVYYRFPDVEAMFPGFSIEGAGPVGRPVSKRMEKR